jgi:hypothetical protein
VFLGDVGTKTPPKTFQQKGDGDFFNQNIDLENKQNKFSTWILFIAFLMFRGKGSSKTANPYLAKRNMPP